MAAELLGGAALGAAFGELLKAVLEVKDKVSNFENILAYLSKTLRSIDPVIKEIGQYNNELGRSNEEIESLIKEMEEGTKLVYKCSKIHKLNFPARIRYQEELAKLVGSLERFFRFDMQAQASRDSKETLLKVTRVLSAVNKLPLARILSAVNKLPLATNEDTTTMGSSSGTDPVVPLERDTCEPNNGEDETDQTDPDPIEESTESEIQILNSADQVLEDITSLEHRVSQADTQILKDPHEDPENNFEATTDKLRSSIQFFGSKMGLKSSDAFAYHGNNLLAKTVSKLEDEFKELISLCSKPVEPERLFDCLPNSMRRLSGSPRNEGDPSGKNPSSNHHSESHNNNNNAEAVVFTPPAHILPTILPVLHDLAQLMVEAGHQQQLLKIYRDTRSKVLEEGIQMFGIEKLNNDNVDKLQWEVLDAKIENWIHFMRIAVRLLFAGEREVCAQIFEGFDSLSEQCFAEATTNSVSMLLSFGEAIAKSKRSPEKLFVLLDMYEIMQELHSEIQTLFKGKACTELREAAIGLTKRLAQTVQETIADFEAVVEKDATETAVTDGTVHPFTRYVINYVKCLIEYRSNLIQLFQEFEGGDNYSELACVTTRIMRALQTNLDRKSEQYSDPALKHLFLMNNILYIVRSVEGHKAKDLLGDDWAQQHMRIVQQHANQYKRNAWAKALQCLSISDTSLAGVRTNSATRAIFKDRFGTFNDMFKELHKKQSKWTIPDGELRESLRLAVVVLLLPAYRTFMGRFGGIVQSERNPQKYIKYTAEDLEQMLGEFFEGTK